MLSLKLMAVCMAAYESTGSQVQLSLERGLPAVIGNFISKQLPFPSLSYDMVHCAQCGILWENKGIDLAITGTPIPFPLFRCSMHNFTLALQILTAFFVHTHFLSFTVISFFVVCLIS